MEELGPGFGDPPLQVEILGWDPFLRVELEELGPSVGNSSLVYLVIHSGESLFNVGVGGNGLSSRTVSGIPEIRVILFLKPLMNDQ